MLALDTMESYSTLLIAAGTGVATCRIQPQCCPAGVSAANQLREHLAKHGIGIKAKLLNGSFKPNGGIRPLSICFGPPQALTRSRGQPAGWLSRSARRWQRWHNASGRRAALTRLGIPAVAEPGRMAEARRAARSPQQPRAQETWVYHAN